MMPFSAPWLNGARREVMGGETRKGATFTSHSNGTFLLPPPLPHPQDPSLLLFTISDLTHCRGSIIQFPDLVGCILLCKHSPLGLWNPKQHLYFHLNGERPYSPEISPQVAFVVCFLLLKTGMGWGGHRTRSCKQIVEI